MQKRVQSSNGEPARHRNLRFAGQVGRTHRDGPLNAWVQPHQTDATKPLFDRDTEQRKAKAVERMGRINDLNRINGECC